MKRIIPYLLLVLLAGVTCKNAAEKEGPTQMQRVMAVHDEVMPEMKTIANLVGELQPKVDTTEQGIRYGKAVEDLQGAHRAMFTWMQEFGERFTPDEILNAAPLSEEKQNWLDEEEEKAMALKEQILESIKNAQALAKEE